MGARLCWVCEESDCWKVIWDRCFGGFEDQRGWESSSDLRRASVYAALRLWKIRFDNKMITVDILTLF